MDIKFGKLRNKKVSFILFQNYKVKDTHFKTVVSKF